MFPYLEIMFKNDELAWEISDFLELEENEIKRFRSRKIPKKVITKMEKQKAQMRVEERDRRYEELQNQMMNAPIEEEPVEDDLPFEISDAEPASEIEEPIENIEEEVAEIPEEEIKTEEESPEDTETDKKEKKKTDKQVSLFSF